MAWDEGKMPYFMLNVRNTDFDNCNHLYRRRSFKCDNYQNSYRNEQYGNAYGDYNGGYSSEYGFRQNFSQPNPGFYGFQSEQYPSGSPQRSRSPQDLHRNVSEHDFNPHGPPEKEKLTEDKIIKALIAGGVPKDVVMNLPRSLLMLYQPEYCGLCSQAFDTVATSHVHYNCKNHKKKQDKWLSQQTDSSFLCYKEKPLKARELYCEICDVHITSKVLSESHYAGKPHRAIVEGRKAPKNPFLMQPGMEDRLEQLIRREKKHLRLGKEDTAEEAKATHSELYCEICNAPVTCAEQMVMHLNGKRHLTKEKQYIFRMMKEGAPQPPEKV